MSQTLILTEKEGWHFHQLKNSLLKQNYTVISACLSQVSIHIENNESIIYIHGKKIPHIDNVIVRFIPGGTLEEIVFFLNILKILEAMGIKVINTATSIESTVDKLYTSYLLDNNNIKTPATYVMRSYEEACRFIRDNSKNSTWIYKPLFGSQGDNIKLIKSSHDLNTFENLSNVYYFQKYLENSTSYDFRVLVIRNGEKVKYFYMTRYGSTFVNNFSKGAKCIKEDINQKVIDLAIKSSKLLNIDFCGVDIIEYKNNYYVIEVNSIPAWKGLQAVEDECIADYIINYLF